LIGCLCDSVCVCVCVCVCDFFGKFSPRHQSEDQVLAQPGIKWLLSEGGLRV
jgi:hypothetical protein